jgi:hypothetical protein
MPPVHELPERNNAVSSSRGEGRATTSGGRWVAPTMVTLLLVGLIWIVVYYVARDDIPLMRDIGGWNLVIGMGLITGGFITATQWK